MGYKSVILCDSYCVCVCQTPCCSERVSCLPNFTFCHITVLLLASANCPCLSMPSSNLLEVWSYLLAWAKVVGSQNPSSENYGPIAPMNQHFQSYSLFPDILLGIRRKTEMSKISSLWEYSNFINNSTYPSQECKWDFWKLVWPTHMKFACNTSFKLDLPCLHMCF